MHSCKICELPSTVTCYFDLSVNTLTTTNMPSVLWHCWLGGRKGIWPVKTEWWGVGTVICLERGADLHMAQLMPLPLIVSCFSKIQIGFAFLVPANPGSPGHRAVKRVCVCVCEYPVYSLVSLSTDTNRLVWLPRLKLSLALSDLSQCICINLLNNIWFHFVLWYLNVWLQCRCKGYSVLSWQLKPNPRPRFSSEPTVTDHQEKFRTVAMLSLSTTRLLTEGVLLLLYQLSVKGLRHHAW